MNHSPTAHNAYPTPDTTPQGLRTQNLIREPLTSQTLPGRFIVPMFPARRHRKLVLSTNISNLQAALSTTATTPNNISTKATDSPLDKPTIRRLGRRGGIRRIQNDIYATVQDVVRERLKLILRHTVTLVEHAKRKTVTTLDIVYALKLIGTPIYGFGMIEKGMGIPNYAARYQEKLKKMAVNRARVAREIAARRAAEGGDGADEDGEEGMEIEDQEHRDAANRAVDDWQRRIQRGARSES